MAEKTKDFTESYRTEYGGTDIVIKPYFDSNVENMGLEKYGQVFFEGTGMIQDLRATEINGVVRYVTGLDEFATEVKMLPEAERKARVAQIKQTVSQLEYELFANKVDPKEPDFWSKVNLAPTNTKYWSTVRLAASNNDVYLDPNDTNDLIKIICAENGGFDEVAPSLEIAKAAAKPPKFYLEKVRDTRAVEGKLKETRDMAIYELYKIRMENPQDLFLLCKNILPIANSYKTKDKPEVWYGDLSNFIEGISIEKDKKKAPLTFLKWKERDKEHLRIRAYVMEAIFLKHLVTKADNKIYIKSTGSMLGGNIEECVEHLKQVQNERDLKTMEDLIEKHWAR